MPWIHKQPKPKNHDCSRPGVRGTQYRQPGDVWQCRQCATKWKLVKPGVVDDLLSTWTDTEPEWERVLGG